MSLNVKNYYQPQLELAFAPQPVVPQHSSFKYPFRKWWLTLEPVRNPLLCWKLRESVALSEGQYLLVMEGLYVE